MSDCRDIYGASGDLRKDAAARAVQAADLRALARVGAGGSGRPGGFSRTADRALMLLLFAVVIFALLGLLALGVNAYRTLAEDRTDASALRQESGLLLNTVRANDAADAVAVGEGPEGPSLVLVERLDSGTYETRLYAYQGAIMQEYVVAGAEYDPASATQVADSQTFEFSYDETSGLLTVVTDAGEAHIALRCANGAANVAGSAEVTPPSVSADSSDGESRPASVLNEGEGAAAFSATAAGSAAGEGAGDE